MQSMLIRPKHISVRNPQAPGPRSRSALCSRRRRYDARIPPIFADHLRSSVLCSQCRQARGGIPLVAISVRACMPGNGFSLRERLYWYTFFYFDLTEGSLGNTVAGWCHWSQTRFGNARGERSRPQFTAHNSVRPFENGIRSVGSSATRPSQQASPAPSSWHTKLGLRGRQEPPAGARVTASSPLPDLMPVSQVRKRRVFAGPLTMCMERLSTRAPPIKVGWVGGAFEPTLQAARPWACEASPHLSSGAGSLAATLQVENCGRW